MVTVVTVVVADQVSQFGDQMRRAKPLMNTGPSQVEGQYCLSILYDSANAADAAAC